MNDKPFFIKANNSILRSMLRGREIRCNHGKWMGKYLAVFIPEGFKEYVYCGTPDYDLKNIPNFSKSIDCMNNITLFENLVRHISNNSNFKFGVCVESCLIIRQEPIFNRLAIIVYSYKNKKRNINGYEDAISKTEYECGNFYKMSRFVQESVVGSFFREATMDEIVKYYL